MTEQEKISTLADILELDESEVIPELVLEECEAWDSVAVLSVIAVMNDAFNRFPHANEIRSYRTVGDLLNAMAGGAAE
ncbi:MAG: acyl carrier protein [Lachnospiraceae bacterium]|nr:acyl carrier protein [Lachnospiraceae bacterium]